MSGARDRPSRLAKAGFKVPVWIYQAHLGFLFMGRIIAIVHRGRRSGRRYVTGLEVVERCDGELFVFAAWGSRSDWYRNIEANGVDELWDGRQRSRDVGFRVMTSDEAFEAIARYERDHPRSARAVLPRVLPGYDFSDKARRELVDLGALVAFRAA
jgi:deazaflavin-dependent oxidoreductase (nitroreductase family)